MKHPLIDKKEILTYYNYGEHIIKRGCRCTRIKIRILFSYAVGWKNCHTTLDDKFTRLYMSKHPKISKN